MRRLPILLGVAALLTGLYLWAEATWPASEVKEQETDALTRFPEVTGSNLEGKRYNLPQDLEGEKNLCFIAFTREQQSDVDTWLEGIKPLKNTPGLEIYELPTIFPGTSFFRVWLDSAMHQGIPDRSQREHTITLYLDKVAFRKTLDLPSEDCIYTLLLNRTGEILWRAEGLFDSEKDSALRTVLGLA